ncbi:MAG: putative hydrolase [Candidatus Poriferisodalaceae bacterium]|jgi:putative hydrolase
MLGRVGEMHNDVDTSECRLKSSGRTKKVQQFIANRPVRRRGRRFVYCDHFFDARRRGKQANNASSYGPTGPRYRDAAELRRRLGGETAVDRRFDRHTMTIVTDDRPSDDDNPFGGLPFFGDLGKMFQASGPVNWDAARQFAQSLATGGASEPNVEPSDRIKLEEMARIAELHVASATGLDLAADGTPPTVLAVTRSAWAQRTLDAYRPLLERLAERLSMQIDRPDGSGAPEEQLLSGMFKFLNPMMMAMTSGSMAGHLATTALGQYDLPVPRSGNEIAVVAANINEFAEEWSIPLDDARLWVCIHELTFHAVLSVPHVRDTLMDLIARYIDGFQSNPHALEERLGGLEIGSGDPMDLQNQLQNVLGDPEALLGAMRSDDQAATVPHLEALLAVVVGYVDHIMDTVATGLIGSVGLLTEAFRRKRVTAAQADRFVERLLGVDVTADVVERGRDFVAGVVERADAEGLARLWEKAENLPTVNELAAPGLWLARIDLPND